MWIWNHSGWSTSADWHSIIEALKVSSAYMLIMSANHLCFHYIRVCLLNKSCWHCLLQTSYPRTASVRKGWALRQLIKLVIFTGLMGFIIEQVSLFPTKKLAYCVESRMCKSSGINWCGFLALMLQYINPIVQNSRHPLKADLLYGMERILKLSVPTLYVWLCMFYCFFHLW